MDKVDFDVLFLDTTSKKFYDLHTLENQGLGGTEATVVRIAEGLAGFGLRVAVVQAQPGYFEPTLSKFAFYFHVDDLHSLTCKHFIQIRSKGNSHLYPKAKKYIWLHDTADEGLKDWQEPISKNNITVLGVSKFHETEIKKHITSRVKYIYNPVPDEIYKPTDIEMKYDKNVMVWASSPHKGLGKALEVYRKIRERIPLMTLLIANPGYLSIDKVAIHEIPGVSLMGPQPARILWQVLEKSLCLYYPSQYDETFGLVLAEANALGVPMLGYKHGALNEVVSSDDQLVQDGNETELINRAVDWYNGGRLTVTGRREFELSRIVMSWVQMLAGQND